MRSLPRCSRPWWLSSFALALLACGGPSARDPGQPQPAGAAEGGGSDRGIDGGNGDADEGAGGSDGDPAPPGPADQIRIDPPAPPAPPEFADWTCPSGWSPRDVERGEPWAFSICEVPSPPDCEGAEYAVPGGLTCRTLGRDCDDPISLEGVVIHVDPAAAPGGDGARATPLNSLSAAVALPLAEGATIVLAPGDHPGEITLDRPMTLQGACASGVVVGPLTVTAAGPVVLDDLTLRAGAPSLDIQAPASDVTATDLLIEGATDRAIAVVLDGGAVRLERVVVRDVLTDNPVGEGNALFVRNAGRTEIVDAVFEDCGGSCVFIGAHPEAGPGRVSITRSVLRRSLALPTEHPSLLRIWDGAGADLDQVILEHAADVGILIGQSGSGAPPLVTLTDCIVRDIQAEGSPNAIGVGLNNAGRLVVTRTLFEGLDGPAVAVSAAADGLAGVPSAELTDIFVRGSVAETSVASGVGVEQAGFMSLRRAVFERGGAAVVSIQSDAQRQAELHVEDVVIRDSAALDSDGEVDWPGLGRIRVVREEAVGVYVYGGRLEGQRIAIIGQPRAAVSVRGQAERTTEVELTDLQVRGSIATDISFPGLTDPPLRVLPGQAIAVLGDADVSVTRIGVRDMQGQLVMALGDQPTGSPRVRIIDAQGADFTEQEGRAGLAVAAGLGAELTLVRTELLRASVMAVVAWGWPGQPQTRVDADHLRILGAAAATCGELPEEQEGSCVIDGQSFAGGIGILAREGGRLTARDFNVSGAALAGVVLATDARLELHRGVITDNTIGLNIMVDGADLQLLDDQVFAFDNGVDFAQQTLPLPSVSGFFGDD